MTAHDWMTLRIAPGSHKDAVLAALFDSGVLAVQEVEGGLAVAGAAVAGATVAEHGFEVIGCGYRTHRSQV